MCGIKLYMIRERVSNTYFSEVAGIVRQDEREMAYVYDRKHATRVLADAEQYIREILASDDIPDEDKYLPILELEEVSLNDVLIHDYSLSRTWADKLQHGFTEQEVARICRYEQVRRFNNYIDYDLNSPSHWYNYIMESI